MDEYKIDDVARECGLTKRTIRYYEEIGVFPTPERSEGGTRLYTREDIEYLKKIVNAKEILGFSLQELVSYLSVSDAYKLHHQTYHDMTSRAHRRQQLTHMSEMLEEQLQMLRTKVDKMRLMQQELEQTQTRLDDFIRKFDEETDSRES